VHSVTLIFRAETGHSKEAFTHAQNVNLGLDALCLPSRQEVAGRKEVGHESEGLSPLANSLLIMIGAEIGKDGVQGGE